MTIEQKPQDERIAHPARCGISQRLATILQATLVATAFLSFPGCGEHDELPDVSKQAVKLDEVPGNVRSAAAKAIPGVKFDEAWKNLASGGKLQSYEIRGKNAADGKIREVRVSLTGEILEME
jgi:hypothetical protein